MSSSSPDHVPITDERYLHVILRYSGILSTRVLADFVLDGVYFESDPAFDPVPWEQPESALSVLRVTWDPDRPPVMIRLASSEERQKAIEEALEVLRIPPEEGNRAVDVSEEQERIGAAQGQVEGGSQVVTVVVDGETMTDEAWAMVDSLEAFLAREYDGIVFAPGDGLFDSQLQPIRRLSER